MAEAFAPFAPLRRFAWWLQGLQGWWRCVAALVAGLVTALGFAPANAWPFLFLTFPALVWLIDGSQARGADWRRAFATGWSFGFGNFIAGMHWIAYPFLVDPDAHAWQIPFVLILFPGGLGLFWAAGVTLAARFWRAGIARVPVFVASACAFEWLRGHVLTGLPWNLPGYVWSGSATMMQSASIYGIYGLSLVTLLAVSVLAAVVGADGKVGRGGPAVACAMGLLAGLWCFGVLRLPADADPLFDNVRLRLVQPDVPQNEKWRPELMMRNWQQLVDLSRKPGLERISAVIWPEAAPPFPLLSTEGALEAAGALLPDLTVLLTGTQRFERGAETGRPTRYFNSVVAVDGKGRVAAIYDKSHLVPFGEYLPLFQLLAPMGLSQLTGLHGGFSSGDGVRTFHVAALPPFTVLVCYEAIFPADVVPAGIRPAWLVNVTDDSWFGPWAGPNQHLGIARVRAVEEGLAIARAANTGISAVIDPHGRIISSLGLSTAGVLDAALPKPLKPTVYSLFGDAIFVVMMAILLVAAGFFSRSTP